MARIEKRLIWSGWLRLSHLLIGLATLLLIGSGWLLEYAPSVASVSRDTHFYAASLLVAGLGLRLLLLFFGSPNERLARLMPDEGEWRAARATLWFYLSFARTQLPRWHAHNPAWKPVYLLFLVALLILAISGWLRQQSVLWMGFYLPDVHATFAVLVFWLVVLHVLAVLLHDYRGDAADVSSMINGYRHFVIDPMRNEGPSVHLDQIQRPDSTEKQ